MRPDTVIKTGRWVKCVEESGTEPRVYYLPPKDRKYDSPDEKRAKQAAEAMS